MKIWVDADACPKVIKEILFRAAERLEIPTTLFANKLLRTPPSRFIRAVQVQRGLDAADREIVARLEPGDLVITADVPLAARAVKAGAETIGPNGKAFTEDAIGMTLATRNLMSDLRSAGAITTGPKPFAAGDRSRFLSALDAALMRLTRAGYGQS